MVRSHLNRLILFLAIFCLAIVCALFVVRMLRPRPNPHILLITLDTTRWDHLSCYGHSEETTPVIDELAKIGVRYQYALTPSSWTLPSHASIFTGVLPTHHGAHYVPSHGEMRLGSMQIDRLDSQLPTLAEELKKAGYRTGAVIGGPLLHSSFGIGRGFDFYHDEDLNSYKGYEFYRSARETSLSAISWLQHYYSTDDSSPFFLFLNYYDPHNPYQPPDPWGNPEVPEELYDIHSGRYDDVISGKHGLKGEEKDVLLSQYDNEIRFMDRQIGRLFYSMKQLGLYDDTLVVITSDHGESFGEHRLLGHGRALYEELVRVPLIIKYPLKDSRRGIVERRVSIISIMPTLLRYIGHPVPKTVECGTLDDQNQILVTEIYRDRFWIKAYGERFDRDQKATYDGNYKWIWHSNGKHELYDIACDPNEENNLQGKLSKVEHHFQAKLAPLIHNSKQARPYAPPEVGENLKQRLRALGYMH